MTYKFFLFIIILFLFINDSNPRARGACPKTCKSCVSIFSSTCVDCKPKYYFSSGKCFSCSIYFKNCTRCSKLTCEKCDRGYYLNETNCISCITKFDPFCDACNETRCRSCSEGYYIQRKNQTCGKCIENCSLCNNTTSCLKCKDGYFSLNSSCIACQTKFIKNCNVCNETSCLQCQQGFFITENKNCTKCPNNCIDCNSSKCDNCKQGFIWDNSTNSCVKNIIDQKKNRNNNSLDNDLNINTSEESNIDLLPILIGVIVGVLIIFISILAYCNYKKYKKNKTKKFSPVLPENIDNHNEIKKKTVLSNIVALDSQDTLVDTEKIQIDTNFRKKDKNNAI